MWNCIFWTTSVKGTQILAELPILLTYNYGGTIDVRFVLSSKGALVRNSSVSVSVLNRTSPSLCTHFLLIHYSTFGRILDFLIVHVVLLAIPGETVYEMLHELLHDVIHKVVTSKI